MSQHFLHATTAEVSLRLPPEVLREPVQQETGGNQPIRFTKNDYEYELTPLYDYEINGLIVSKRSYKFLTLESDRYEKVFPVDLALIWGSNVASKVYQNRNVKFSQDCRWAYVNWYGNIDFNLNEMSNNHLLVDGPDLEKKIKTLVVGDQVKLRGKLVNVKAHLVGEVKGSEPESIFWNTSTTREDSRGGACEVVYVEDLKILRKANVISYALFQISLYGLALMTVWNLLWFFFGSNRSQLRGD